ncbi:energy transducer TonB [Pseudorhodoferax sp.]|uniref:energy transducer TonB n=1 Tax=Pseudorhodoferax sp. TaxID=1993553 RepID=UPI002DD61B46|nr:TonB family protein [Pseudorhodoferax sp.]
MRAALGGKVALTPLHGALLLSLAVHVVLVTVQVAGPERLERVLRDTPLEVILVNARSTEAPLRAQAIAQAQLAGGGSAEGGRAMSPLPAQATLQHGDATDDARRRVEQLQQEQQQLLTQVRRELALMASLDPRADSGRADERDQEERKRQLLRLLAEIERRVNEENARPKKRYISPATQEAPYAQYYNALKTRIEERGTRDFPEFQGRKLYGELTMNVTIDADGRVVDTEILRPSRVPQLDQRALAIVRAAGPFGRFTPAMRRQADQIVITSRFRFTRDEGFETSLSANR